MTAQYFSSLALVTAVVVYLLAFSMHTLEWASARKIKADATEPVPEPALVGAAQTSGLVESSPELVERSPELVERSPELVEGSPELVGSSPELVEGLDRG